MYIVEFGYGYHPWQWQRGCQVSFIDKGLAEQFAENSMRFSRLMDKPPYVINGYFIREMKLSFDAKQEIVKQYFEEQ